MGRLKFATRLDAEQTEALERGVGELELSVRTQNMLQNLKITHVRQLVQKSKQELINAGMAKVSAEEIIAVLEVMGLRLEM